MHVEPRGVYQTAQHYVGDLVYGANDGILTSFAVVAGVTGGSLSSGIVLIVGLANLFADGLSMGVGNYLSIRARESALEQQQRPEEESWPGRHGLATFVAFVVAGAVPLLPYFVASAERPFALAAASAMAALFAVWSREDTGHRKSMVGEWPGDADAGSRRGRCGLWNRCRDCPGGGRRHLV